MKEDWNLENVEVEFNLQMPRLLFFLFPAAFLLNLTQLPLNFEFLFLVCLQSDMFAVGGYESTLLCCIGVSDRRSVIVTSFFFLFCFYIDLRLLYFCFIVIAVIFKESSFNIVLAKQRCQF